MFVRWRKDGLVRTVDMNQVVMVHVDETWGPSQCRVRIDTPNNYSIIAEGLTLDEAVALEIKLLEAWANRSYNLITLD